MRFRSRKAAVCSGAAMALLLAASASGQTPEEMDILRMIYKDKDLVVTPTRSPKPISQVAENVTVISAAEIEAINAHTLTDVLYLVTGVQMDIQGGPGSVANAYIQGSDPRHVQVMVDGVSLNNLSDNFADIGSFPVQQIERIEIVKGPASSAWGSSLGGIINIITKSADPKRRFGGMASASIGERTTGDFRAEASGTLGSLGYYLYGGGLTSDGLTPNNRYDAGDLYTKLQWQATEKARLQLSLGYDKGGRGEGEIPGVATRRDRFEYLFSTLSLNYALTPAMNLDLSGRVAKRRIAFFTDMAGIGEFVNSFDDLKTGGSAKLAWQGGMHSLLVGFDYDNGRLEAASITGGGQRLEKRAVFANDTLSLGDFSVTPGLRYDYTSTNGDFLSPSLGLTYTPFEQTVLRAYVARGFNIPPLSATFGGVPPFGPNPGLGVEKVWSYSVGGETAIFRYFWVKASGFIHDIRDVIADEQLPDGTVISVNKGKQRRQGVEAELRTVPLWNTSLLAGFTFIDARDRETDQQIQGIPRYTYDLGVDYNDHSIFRGALRGHFIWWNAAPLPGTNIYGRYKAIIWDLHLSRKVIERGRTSLEAFFSAHNLFNGSQYSTGIFPNPRRWFEGGLRVRF